MFTFLSTTKQCKCVLVQVLDELKQRELGNSEKEERMQVKKKTINLLPDADNNLLKLQVGGLRDKSSKQVLRLDFVQTCAFVASGSGGVQCQTGGKPGLSVGKTPRSTH